MQTRDRYLSQSKIHLYNRCPFLYKLIEVDRLVRRIQPGPMRRGTLVHKGYEAALRWEWSTRQLNQFGAVPPGWDRDNPKQFLQQMLRVGEVTMRQAQMRWLADPTVKPFISDADREEADRMVDDAVKIFRRSFTALDIHLGKWKTAVAPNGGPFIEWQMRAPETIPGWGGYQGTLDWIAEDQRGHLWLWDFKTRKVLKSEEYDRMQTQAPGYLYLLGHLHGLYVVGSVTYQIRAATRQIPTLNKTKKKGEDRPGMSRAKWRTDWPTYMQALLDNGLDPADYLDMKDKLPAAFDVVTPYYRGDHEVFAVWANIRHSAWRINEAEMADRWPRNLNPYNCKGCTHRTYCEADLQAQDTETLARTEYMHAEDGQAYLPVHVKDEDDD